MGKFSINWRLLIIWLLICGLCLPVITACQQQTEQPDESILVFAAASLRDVMEEVAQIYKKQTGVSVVFNFAGSNVLAQQIAASPKADIFLSANIQWMEHLAKQNRIDIENKRQFLSNKLVFIAHKDNQFELSTPDKLSDLPFRYLSIGDPQAVPAGRYAKAYLNSLSHKQESVWSNLSNRILPAADVKAATAVVEVMPDIIGIVYKTDALASSKVRILYEPKVDKNLNIQYIAARIRKANLDSTMDSSMNENLYHAKASDFLDFLSHNTSTSIFQKHGFLALANDQIAEARGASH